MAGAVWDMITSGPDAGTVIQPLRYTQTPGESTRVNAWNQLATKLRSYKLRRPDGLDHDLILDDSSTDQDRAAEVTRSLLAVEGVASIAGVDISRETLADGSERINLAASGTAESGEPFTIGAAL
jgi:hypothetical protein